MNRRNANGIIHLLFTYCILVLGISSCQSQPDKGNKQKRVGGPCEGCEAIYEFGEQTLTNSDTLPNFEAEEPKLKISGIVYQKDGKTPAGDVILYIYQTNRKGIYETKGDETGWARRHGYIRGWMKTKADGRYSFYTFRPAAYPDRSEPEHIHLTVKEPDYNEYYLDSFHFSDDSLLTQEVRRRLENRGGSGVVELTSESGMLTANRDIILGLNIPDYE